MSKNYMIQQFSAALQSRNAALFVGAGISQPSGLPTWSELLESDAAQIGLTIEDGDCLPSIAQYLVNHNVGNRGPLVNQIRHALRASKGPNAYHKALSQSTVDTIWTTNYDTLLEEAFYLFSTRVRTKDSSMSDPSGAVELEIIKAHGCINSSEPEDLVITKEDYEDFFCRRPATAERLRTDLLRRTFLFVGYGFGDPNIENILVEARRLSRKATQRHYLIQKRVSEGAGLKQQSIRQMLWVKDLRRIGIECILIDEHAELQEILDEIALRSRGPTLYITGSHEHNSVLAAEIGRNLANCAKPPLTILDGQSSGLSRDLISAFTEECVNMKIDIMTRLRIYPNPYAANPAFSNYEKLLPMLKQLRRKPLRSAQVVLSFDGGMGTQMEVELALSLGCRVIPIPLDRGKSAERLLSRSEIADPISSICPDYLEKCRAGMQVSAGDVARCVAEMTK